MRILIRRFFFASKQDRLLVIKASVLLVGVRMGLWLLSFRDLQRLVGKISQPSSPGKNDDNPDRVAWAVWTASRYIPKATCLAQALTTQIMIARQGQSSELIIGVSREGESAMKAHAWLEIDGRSIIGGHQLDGYTKLMSIKRKVK